MLGERDVQIELNAPEGDEKPAEAQNTPSNLAEAVLVIEELRHSLELASCEKQQAVLSERRWKNKLTSMRELQDLVMVDQNLQHQQAMAEVATAAGEMGHSVGVSDALHEAELREAKAVSDQLRQYLIESLECYTARVKELEDEKVSEQAHHHSEHASKQLQHLEQLQCIKAPSKENAKLKKIYQATCACTSPGASGMTPNILLQCRNHMLLNYWEQELDCHQDFD